MSNYTELEEIINLLPEMIWKIHVVNPCSTTTVYTNNSWKNYTKYKDIFDPMLTHPDDKETIMNIWTSCVNTCKPFEVNRRLKGNDGVYRWFLTRAKFYKSNYWCGSCIDINELMLTRLDKASKKKIADDDLIIAEQAKINANDDLIIAERSRVALANDKKIADDDLLVAEGVRLALANDKIIADDDLLVAERSRLALANDKKIADDDLIIAEQSRLALANDKKIADDDIIIAEKMRLRLVKNVQTLEENAKNLAYRAFVAEFTRITLSETAENLALKALNDAREKILTEEIRVSLCEEALQKEQMTVDLVKKYELLEYKNQQLVFLLYKLINKEEKD